MGRKKRAYRRPAGHDPAVDKNLEQFHAWYNATLAEKLALAEDYHAREPFWSEASVIGSETFVRELGGAPLRGRQEPWCYFPFCDLELPIHHYPWRKFWSARGGATALEVRPQKDANLDQ